MRRRTLLGVGAAAPLAACLPPADALPPCRWVGASVERGHRLRDTTTPTRPTPARRHRVGALVLGGGVAGLSALRSLVASGHDDAQLLELEDEVGGNSRGHMLAGSACPMGAHYLPVPDESAREVQEWLQQIGLLRMTAAGLQPDERHLCHSLQERLFIDGAWQEGLLPSAQERPGTLQQYRRFAQAVSEVRRLGFAIPSHHAPWTPAHDALDALRFDRWLAAQGLDDTRLLGYLDYCCRDDYGAGVSQVSAWAGLHYFASRHGFQVPGEDNAERDALFTWPEGNHHLVQALARPLAARLATARVVLRVTQQRHGVEVLAWDAARSTLESWQADTVVVALPLHVAARVCDGLAPALQTALASAAQATRYAPWLVANLALNAPLMARPGAPLAWDNVAFAPAGTTVSLGYVDARHQSLRPDVAQAEPPVFTAYLALPEADRGRLWRNTPAQWTRELLALFAPLHPDLPQRLARADLTRWGHAMSIPAPGVRGQPARQALRQARGRIRFAHTDLAGYSVFEEAFTLGVEAARDAQI